MLCLALLGATFAIAASARYSAAAPATKPLAAAADAASPAGPQRFVHRISGLFGPPAVDDLRVALEGLPGVELIAADLEYGEATFTYDPAKAFPGVKPDKIIERFNDGLRTASKQMFGVREISTTSREKLARVEIRLVAIDCKVCCLALQEILLRQDGVEQATVDMREGLATALIDPAKTSREKLEAALKSREIALRGE